MIWSRSSFTNIKVHRLTVLWSNKFSLVFARQLYRAMVYPSALFYNFPCSFFPLLCYDIAPELFLSIKGHVPLFHVFFGLGSALDLRNPHQYLYSFLFLVSSCKLVYS